MKYLQQISFMILSLLVLTCYMKEFRNGEFTETPTKLDESLLVLSRDQRDVTRAKSFEYCQGLPLAYRESCFRNIRLKRQMEQRKKKAYFKELHRPKKFRVKCHELPTLQMRQRCKKDKKYKGKLYKMSI